MVKLFLSSCHLRALPPREANEVAHRQLTTPMSVWFDTPPNV
jgi:hypothetical protein